MAIPRNIWDEYQQYVQSGGALAAAKAAAVGQKAAPKVTPGNAAWQANQPGGQPQPQPTPIPHQPNDPINAAMNAVQGMQQGLSAGQALSNFPAVNQVNKNTQFATNAPVNTLDMNAIPSIDQIPIGGFGLGALSQAGYSRSPQFSLDSNQPSQPTMTGFKWNAGTGGVSGGNNDMLRQFYSNGTSQTFIGGINQNQPLAPTQYALPVLNQPKGTVNPLADPSVGALEGAQRSTNQYGQQVVQSPTGQGTMISGPSGSPSYGSLMGSTPAADKFNRPGLNTPSGGQAFAGPSLRKRAPSMTPGQTYSLGGWY